MANITQKRLRECVDDELNFIECPKCGDDDFSSSRGVAMHYAYNHEGSLKNFYECDECGRLKFGAGGGSTFCSKWCEVYDKVGTFKHFDKDFLKEEVEEKGKRGAEIAQEIGVSKNVIWKYIERFDIGNEYDCPSCDNSYPTKQGVSKHHKDEHGKSISGTTYTCQYCGEENWTPRSEYDDKLPKYCDDDCFGKSIEGQENPNKDPERQQKIRERMEEVHEKGMGDYGDRDREWMMENVINERDNEYLYEQDHIINDSLISEPVYVEETDRKVRSTWEKEVDLMLYHSEFEYEYEPQMFDIGNRKYMPDFIVEGSVVIEVKGYVSDDAPNKAEMFMEEHPEYTYFVVGSDIPNDERLSWNEREQLTEILTDILDESMPNSLFEY